MNTSLFTGQNVPSNRIIYTPSLFAKNNLIYLQETGEVTAKQLHTSQRENLASYLFFLVVKGSGFLEYNGQTHDLKAGDCVFIDCQKPYAQYTSEDLWTLKWVHFYGSNMKGIYEKYIERGGCPCFHSNNQDIYFRLLDELYEISDSSIFIRDMKIYEKITSLLTLLMEESWNPENSKRNSSHKRNLQNVKDYLDLHYAEKITLDDLAKRFYINKFYLTRIFKEQFGVSATSYLLQVRITHAKQLLRFSDMSIAEIAQECGMNDANYFSRMFRKIEGTSPGDFRKLW